jgi:hypothetical protein
LATRRAISSAVTRNAPSSFPIPFTTCRRQLLKAP